MSKSERIRAIVEDMESSGYTVRAGKWFRRGEEILNIYSYLYAAYRTINSDSDIDSIVRTFRLVYEDRDGSWGEPNIVKEARKLDGKLDPLPIPLTTEQLIIINRLLCPTNTKAFIIYGPSRTGKSTFGKMVCQIFGSHDVATLTLEDMDTPYALANCVGKRLCYGDELNEDTGHAARFKMIATKATTYVNKKYGRDGAETLRCNMLFCTNKLPPFDLSDESLANRIIYYKMDKVISNPDEAMTMQRFDHKTLVNIVAHALRVDISGWEKRFEKTTRELLSKPNTVFMFKDESDYTEYERKCREANKTPYSATKFRDIRKTLWKWGMLNLTPNELSEVTEQERIDNVF